MDNRSDNYKWVLLTLVMLTNMFVIAMPTMGMSVLAKEIADDLGLSLVQVGIVWGVGALPGIVTSLLSGVIGDKLGPKYILVLGTLLSGLLGAARGFSSNFIVLTSLVILLGAVSPFVVLNGMKVCGMWFPSKQLGLANGLISVSMAFGFLMGSFLSATVLSPWLGGWRNVLIAYGLAGALLSIPWAFTRTKALGVHASGQVFSMRRTIKHVVGLKNIWMLSLMLFGLGGCIQGLLGYLPLHLRGMGWSGVGADGALTVFHLVSMIFVLPIALWSDRLGSRKQLLLFSVFMVMLGTALLSVASGWVVWVAVLLVGFVRDATMAVFMTMVIETKGVGPMYAGTATGFALALSGFSSVLAPPIGNGLAVYWSGAPFLFWSGLTLFGLICLAQYKNEGTKKQSVNQVVS